MFTYRLRLQIEPEGGYMVTVPALPGCITYGENLEESIEMAKEAIKLYIEVLQERGEKIPDDRDTLEYIITLGKDKVNEKISPKLKKIVGAVKLPENFDEQNELRFSLERKHL